MDKVTYSKILDLLHREVKPALGCTEPIAVALCVARAVDAYRTEVNPAARDGDISRVTVYVCAGILKNAMGVGIPGTGQIGLPIAVAMAAVCGNWHYGLEVLKDLDANSIARARHLLDGGRVCVRAQDSDKVLYVRAECEFSDGVCSECVVEDEHDHITYVACADRVLLDERIAGAQACDGGDGRFLSLELINEFAREADLADLELIREQIRLNTALSEEGLRGDYGLRVGKTIAEGFSDDVFGKTLDSVCMARTAAGSDARMAGCTLPAMSNSGSGNQGLTVSLPVIATAEYLGSGEDQLIRALAVSNLVAIHIKSYLGRLSALCGCVVASTGSSCGIVMLKGGGVEEMASAIKNMIGSITGMICDGAKEGCALKVACGVSCALQSAVLALKGICAQPTDGIIDADIEKTIQNLGNIGARGMKSTDSLILDIMLCK